jgi:hypothetical protein
LAQIDTNAFFTVPSVMAEATFRCEIEPSISLVNHDQPTPLEIGVHLGSDGVTRLPFRHRVPARQSDQQYRSSRSAGEPAGQRFSAACDRTQDELLVAARFTRHNR